MPSFDIAPSILSQLQGAQLILPNMRPLYAGWASGVSPHYDALVSFTNNVYERLLPEKKAFEKAKSCDFGYTSAGWFPSSDLERLKFMATYCAWFFCWDDTIDREGVSVAEGDLYRAEALDYIRYHLGIAPAGTPEPRASTVQLEVFAGVGQHLRTHCDQDLIEAFFFEVQHTIACCGREQAMAEAGGLPSKQDYWDVRMGTSGVYPYCAIAPHMTGVKLPWKLFYSPEMRAVWDAINVNVIIFNDIISLKKEVADNATTSLIPVTMAEDGVSLTEATKSVYEQLVANTRGFDHALKMLRREAKAYDKKVQEDTEKVIQCYEAFVTGVMNWSYTNARYRVAQDIQADGTLITTL